MKNYTRAFSQTFSSEMRGLLLKIIGFTLLILIALGIVLQRIAAYFLTITKWAYVETALEIITGVGLALGLLFLIAPASAIITGLFGDKIAETTEKKSYPDVKATPLPAITALFEGVKISLISLGINFIALLFLFTGIGFLILIVANAYLMSREYFEMVAMRHLTPEKAKALRRENSVKIMLYGLPIGVFMTIPFLNLATPLFGMVLFTHVFQGIKR